MRIGSAAISLAELALHQLHKLPRRSLVVAHAVGGSKLAERAITAKDAGKSAQHILKVAGKKGAVNVELVGKLLKGALTYILQGRIFHNGKHLLAIIANHLALAPGNRSRKQRHSLYVLQSGEPARKLHRVVGNEIGIVDSCRLTVEEVAKREKFFIVEHCLKELMLFFYCFFREK